MPRSRLIEIGQRFGRLTVVGEGGMVPCNHYTRRLIRCLCDCGSTRTVQLSNLTTGGTKSCGCRDRDRKRTHGESRSPEYLIWAGMIRRCTNQNYKQYKDYGGRGIEVCYVWRHSFKAFLDHVGRRPSPKHTIDRIDVNEGYEPGNLKWSTRQEQNANKRSRLTEAQQQELIRMYRDGAHTKVIMAQFGFISKSGMQRFLTRFGVTKRTGKVNF